MQPPHLELDHDGFRARFGAPVAVPRLFGLAAIGAIGLVVAFALGGMGTVPILAALAAAAMNAMLASELGRPWTLEARGGQLRLGRRGGRQHTLEPGSVQLEVVVKTTAAAGPEGQLRQLVLTSGERRYVLPATSWTEPELRAFAQLVRGIRPGQAIPEPPPALRELQARAANRSPEAH